LRRNGQFSDLIQENRAAVGILKYADFVTGRAGEGSLDVTKQFALQQGFDESGAVHGGKWLVGCGASTMKSARNQLFAGAGVPGHKNRFEMRRYAPDLAEDFEHQRASADYVFKLISVQQLTIQQRGSLALLRLGLNIANQRPELQRIQRLGKIVARAFLDGLKGRLFRIVGCRNDHLYPCIRGRYGLQDLDPADVWHEGVDQDDAGMSFEEKTEAGFGIAGGQDFKLVRGKYILHQGKTFPIIVDG